MQNQTALWAVELVESVNLLTASEARDGLLDTLKPDVFWQLASTTDEVV